MKILKITFYMTILMSSINIINAGEVEVVGLTQEQLKRFDQWQNFGADYSSGAKENEEEVVEIYDCEFENSFSTKNSYSLETIRKNQEVSEKIELSEEVKNIERVLKRLQTLKKEFSTDNYVYVTRILESLSVSTYTPDLLKPIIDYNLDLVLAQFMEQNNECFRTEEINFSKRYGAIKRSILDALTQRNSYPESLKEKIRTYLGKSLIREKENNSIFRFI